MPTNSWRERPRRTEEQCVLPLDGTLTGRYQAWRRTPEGQLLYRRFEGAVLLAMVERPARLSAKLIWESLRAKYKQSADNSFAPLVARELEEEMPCLKGMFRHRQRTAA